MKKKKTIIFRIGFSKLTSIILALVILTGCIGSSFGNAKITTNHESDYIDNNSIIHVFLYGDSEKIYTPSSSIVDYIEYFSESKHLIVSLNGKEYVHANVTKQLWNDFKNADSYGSFYVNNLKENTDYWVVGYDGSNGEKIKYEFIHD